MKNMVTYTYIPCISIVQLTMACIGATVCARECVTDHNSTVAAAVTLCFVPNQACSAAIDDLAHHATHHVQ